MKVWMCILCVTVSACAKRPPPEVPQNEISGVTINISELSAADTSSEIGNYSVAATSTAPVQGQDEIRTSVSIIDGSPAQTVYLVPVGDLSKLDKLSEMMEKSGFDCNSVSDAYILRQEDGKLLDAFKINCDTGNFQVTILGDKAYIKAWTGNLLGQ